MRIKNPRIGIILLLVLASFFEMAAGAAAQSQPRSPNSTTDFGMNPYDSLSNRSGNCPGAPWLILGFGHETGIGPDHYPVDGPAPFYGPTQVMPTSPVPLAENGKTAEDVEKASLPAGTALVIVKLPPEAEVWFNETKTSQGGSERRFLTPPLQGDSNLIYAIRVRWLLKDVELARVEEVRVAPGEVFTVNFMTTDSWTGKRLESGPTPRPFQGP